MARALSARDLARLEGVDPDLVRVVKRAAADGDIDFMVVEGVRSDEQCRVNYGKGRTAAQCQAVGIAPQYAQPKLAKVTWLRNPYNSRHRKQADGWGKAVDLLPAPYDWKNLKDFDQLNSAMEAAAKAENVNIRWGADWDEDGVPRERGEADSPHWELA
jgi:peptidoglycan L-alanyl-D-glutamate endopeptidase CwlK